jgi:hypothetical protein
MCTIVPPVHALKCPIRIQEEARLVIDTRDLARREYLQQDQWLAVECRRFVVARVCVIIKSCLFMKRAIEKLSEAEVLKCYPIRGEVDGWYFRLTETSNNAWLVEATDLWNRKVYCCGTDEKALLRECAALAQSVMSQDQGQESATNGQA